ncbi:MAG: outer membrane beta-barrel protein [Syntrophaceae bacterium]
MKRYLVVSLCFLVIIAGVSSAFAQEAKKNYVVGKFGAYFPTSSDVDQFDSTGFNAEVGIGRYITKNLAIELGIGGFGLSSDDTIGFNSVFGAYSSSDTLTVVPLTISLKAVFPLSEKLEIYGIGGLGAYFINFDRDIDSSTLGNDLNYSDDKTAFGGFLGAGAVYNITKMFFAGGELKYHFISSVDFAPPLSGSKSYDLSGFVATANVGFRF